MAGIGKSDFDEELQSAYRMGRILAFFKYGRWRIRFFNALIDRAFAGKTRDGVVTEHRLIKAGAGTHDIPLVIYRPQHTEGPLPVMLYMHGGGYVSGSPEMSPGLENYIAKRPCIIVAPKYRRALTAPYPAALNDCYDALLWIKEHGTTIGGRSDRVIIAGNSAGGGLAAAVTLKNRDQEDIPVAFQMPLYPMLDYRNNSESAQLCAAAPTWDTKSNQVCWGCYLENLHSKNEDIPAYASPALNSDYSDLPPTITFVGGLDPFRDEVVGYANSLRSANIAVEFKEFPKAFHGFEEVVPNAQISQEAKGFVISNYAEFYDKYCGSRVEIPER